MLRIRTRLLIGILLPLVPLTALFMGAVYVQGRATNEVAYDQVLLGSALAIADRVVLENEELSIDLPYVALQMLARSGEERVFYAVRSLPDGELVTGYRDLPQLSLDPAEPHLQTLDFRGEEVRLVAVQSRALNYGREQNFAVYVAETTDARRQVYAELLRLCIAAGLILAFGTLVISVIAVQFGLRPLQQLASAISERGERDLRPIVRRAPPEAAALVKEINALLNRLDHTLTSHRSFVRTTSHQLRTPLAELKAELERSANGGAPLNLSDLAKRIDGLSRLVQQILLLSRVEDQQRSQDLRQRIDLVSAAKRAVAAHWRRAHDAGLDLGLDSKSEQVWVAGNDLLLDEALNNLIENAIQHAKGANKVSVQVDDRLIGVFDNGTEPKELLKNLEVSGTGRFGITIVKQIADLLSCRLRELPEGLQLSWADR